jgi:CDP-glucose 4,6-dehydratase
MSQPLLKSLGKTFAGERVLVTGHTGFKGAWLSEWLVSMGAKVTGFSLPEAPSRPCLFDQLDLAHQIQDIRGDIRDADAVFAALREVCPHFVFHLAAQPLVRLSYRQPVETYQANVLGTINVLEALRPLSDPCVAVMITTDKCYENREWLHGYREEDALGGFDPYSSSKAACELAISSWRRSFFHHHPVRVVSARAGNVIGGGDWATDRIVPDTIRSLIAGQPIPVRNKVATRPWQHVLEPLGGYLTLAATVASGALDELLASALPSATAFNFGPSLDSNRTVADLVKELIRHWPGEWEDKSDPSAPHEATKLNLATDKAFHTLGWQPRWDFETTIARTASWYREATGLRSASEFQALTRRQIEEYQER